MCIIDKCDEPERAKSRLCRNCAANLWFWNKRGVRGIMARREKLQKWENRMEYIGTWKKERK